MLLIIEMNFYIFMNGIRLCAQIVIATYQTNLQEEELIKQC